VWLLPHAGLSVPDKCPKSEARFATPHHLLGTPQTLASVPENGDVHCQQYSSVREVG